MHSGVGGWDKEMMGRSTLEEKIHLKKGWEKGMMRPVVCYRGRDETGELNLEEVKICSEPTCCPGQGSMRVLEEGCIKSQYLQTN